MKVVAISGMSGSGKTSLIKRLSLSLSCPYLLFDDFVDNESYPQNMKEWVLNGACVADIKTPLMEKALSELLNTSKSEYVFVEEPFGKCRLPLSSSIDKAVLLDIPMDICLSRVISRNLTQACGDSTQQINQYLVKYNEFLRDAYIKTNSQTRLRSDLIINKAYSVRELEKIVTQWLRADAN